MSRASNLPPIAHNSSTSNATASHQGGRLSEDPTETLKYPKARTENLSKETSEGDVLWVDWEGPGDPMNPKKWAVQILFVIGDVLTTYTSWPFRQKWAATIIVSSFTFISPASSSMIAPAAAQIAEELGITSGTLVAMTTSIFVLGYGEYLLSAPPQPDFQIHFYE